MDSKQPKQTIDHGPFIYVGHACNNRCFFCFEANDNPSYKTTDQIKKEIDVLRQKFDFINFMGQEPTLRDNLVDLIAYAKKLHFEEIGVTTNGRMLAYPDFTKKILKSGLNQVVVTVAGSTPRMHDSHTLVQGSFKQTLAGIKNMLLFKTPDLSIILNIMITQKNFRNLLRMVDFYANLGMQEINIGHVMPLNTRIVSSDKIIAPMSKVAPLLIQCQDKHGSKIKFLFVEYPACVFAKKYRKMAFPCLEENFNKVRIGLCRKCEYSRSCTGINQLYLSLYGAREFKL